MQNLVLVILVLAGLFYTDPALADGDNSFFTGPPLSDAPTPDGVREFGGFGFRSTNDPVFKTAQLKAASGDARSQYDLGYWYMCKSQYNPAEDELAIKWMKMAAAQSNAPAEFILGTLSTNKADAVKWYQKAAAHGDVSAESLLAECYLHGEGIEHDDQKAFEWFQKAAQQGDVMAYTIMGELFKNGQGTPKDLVQAYKWFNVANLNGHGDTEALKDR